MPDRRRHRGAHPQDERCFAAAALPALRAAAADYRWLLGRGYSPKAALVLVGDRHGLRSRQRIALQRTCAAPAAAKARRSYAVPSEAVAGRELWIDGYNALLTVESALGGAVVLRGDDGALRDMASMAGHFRRVEETRVALEALGRRLAALAPARARWLLDRPISNSGRLRASMLELAEARGWRWEVELEESPDRALIAAPDLVATADGGILDHGVPWLDLPGLVVDAEVPGAWLLSLAPRRRAQPAAAQRSSPARRR